MNINITSPSLAYLQSPTDSEIADLKKQLSYVRNNIRHLIGKHRSNRWFRDKNPDAWGYRLTELQGQLNGSCLLKDESGWFIRPGSISYLKNLNISINSEVNYPKFKLMKWAVPPEFEPYPYQSSSVEALLNIRHGNIALPTGCGKSHILLLLAHRMGLKTVIVTPSKSIFNELLTSFQRHLGKSLVGGYGDGKKDIKKPITIAIGKSLANLKEGTEQYDFFHEKDVIMVDESHTFAAAQLEGVCFGVLSKIPYRFFVSATQVRGDGTGKMLESIIGKTVFEMSLKDAIDKKYLCPLKFLVLDVISPSTVTKRDPIECKRAHFLYNKEIGKASARLANAVVRLNNQSVLILVEELSQISMLKDLLDVSFGYVHSAAKAKASEWGLDKVILQDQVDAFNEGKIKVLIGTRAIATGTNMYPAQFTINWMGGKSEIITKQGPMGRSTRKLEISKFKDLHPPKPFATIIDFNVVGQPILKKHLENRIEYYEEADGIITYKKL